MTTQIPLPNRPGDLLRDRMSQGVVGAPGAFNALVARAVADAGFPAAYVSGGAITTASGVPDIGILTLTEFASIIAQVCRASALPVIADADTGFGEVEMLRRTVCEYHRADAAGFHIEDQVFPKRCGHLDGKELVPIEDFQHIVAAAADARDSLTDSDFIVCARTDAAGVEGIDRAIERAKAYVYAGADMIFPEGLKSEDEFAKFAQALAGYNSGNAPRRAPNDGPFLLANMTEFGKTPIIPLTRFGELGYHLVIWPVSTLRSAMGEIRRLLAALKETGTVSPVIDSMLDRDSLYRLTGYTPGAEWHFPSPTPPTPNPPHSHG